MLNLHSKPRASMAPPNFLDSDPLTCHDVADAFLGHLMAKPRDPRWPSKRDAWLAKHGTCAACGTTRFLTVHHKIPVHVDPSRELDEDNLLTLCETPSGSCHFYLGHLRNWRLYNPHIHLDAARHLEAVVWAMDALKA